MLVVKRVPLASLKFWPKNARQHGPENLDAIKASLASFGQVEPLLVQASTRQVIGGNGRLEVMRSLGWPEGDVCEIDVDDTTAAAIGVALNRSASLGEWNEPVLAEVLKELDAAGAMAGVGFSSDELEELLKKVQNDALANENVDDPGPDEPPVTPVSRSGDLWLLGEHRLLCGDSTKAEDVARVMAGEKAAICATDPPFLVDYTGERPNDSGKDWSDTYREIDIKDASAFFRSVFTNVLSVLAPKAAIYCWHAHKRCGEIQRVWSDLGIVDHQQIVWVKPTAVFGRVYWHFRHEPCAMGWRKGDKPEHDGNHEFDSVWEVDWEGKARVVGNEHPTMKPVELFARPMRKHTKPGDVVFEPFSGSGTSLIAAEKLGRRCRAIEISPAFVDVGLRRWEKATGRAATLDGTGESFTEIAAARGPRANASTTPR